MTTYRNGNGSEPAPAPVAGRVIAVNDKGIKIGDAWLNFSKFGSFPAVERGMSVRATLDKSGRFIQALEILDHAPATSPPATADATQVAGPAPARDVQIVRMSTLKVAADLIARLPEDFGAADNVDLLVDLTLDVAARLERWVLRN